MKRALIIIVLLPVIFALYLITSCSTPRIAQTEQRDTLRIETLSERVFVKDTVWLEIPHQSAERETRVDSSHLENDYAESWARINKDGTLYHRLDTKKQKQPKPFDKPVEKETKSIYKSKEVKVPVPVPTPLTKYQEFAIRWFPILVAVLLLALAYIFRKPFLALIRRFI